MGNVFKLLLSACFYLHSCFCFLCLLWNIGYAHFSQMFIWCVLPRYCLLPTLFTSLDLAAFPLQIQYFRLSISVIFILLKMQVRMLHKSKASVPFWTVLYLPLVLCFSHLLSASYLHLYSLKVLSVCMHFFFRWSFMWYRTIP